MSYLICGKLIFQESLPPGDQIQLSYKVVELALKEQLSLHLECNIVQPIVYEILGQKNQIRFNGTDFAFFITDAPISDTADALISPYEIEPFENPLPTLRKNLNRVNRLLSAVLQLKEIRQVILYLSEGYDDFYREEKISKERFVEHCLQLFNEYGEIPAVKFIIDC